MKTGHVVLKMKAYNVKYFYDVPHFENYLSFVEHLKKIDIFKIIPFYFTDFIMGGNS